MSYKTAISAVCVGILLLITPILGQRIGQKESPSHRFVTYRGTSLEIRFPDNWVVNKTGNTVTLSPEDGNVSGALAYGLLMDIFEPRSRNSSSETLEDATEELIEDLQRTNPNLQVLRSVQKEIGGLAALEVEMTNASPVGGMEVDRLITVRRPNEKLRYFLAVAPQDEASRYSPTFNRMIASIRFYN
jgi:hypothetical protein